MEVYPFEGGSKGLPLAVRPRGNKSADALVAWLAERPEETHNRLLEHGAILFRGFSIETPEDFERVARAIDPELKNEYLGTSPRDGLTDYVFSASELPSYYPIPQHCEMSFTGHPPRRLFFCCLVAPSDGGETPLVDFQRVAEQMDPDVRRRFDEGGIRTIRNYSGPDTGALDLWQLKPWTEMFGTRDRAAVEKKCEEEGFLATWGAGDSLRLVGQHEAFRDHPETGASVWFNHLVVFHLSTAEAEYRRIWQRRRGLRDLALWQFARAMTAGKQLTTEPDAQAMHCTYLDGTEIPTEDIEHVRDLVWKNLVTYPWLEGDVVAIDNNRVGHGRLPYSGARTVAVSWA
jgi:hypothetical protein